MHYTEPLMSEAALAFWRLPHRSACFLYLHEKWIVIISKEKCGETAHADTADPNCLYRYVLELITLKYLPPLRLERFLVFPEKSPTMLFEILNIFVEMVNQQRAALDPPLPIYDCSQLRGIHVNLWD